MSYWIFKVNPERYDIDARLADPEPTDVWRVSSYRKEIQAGDFAFIWRAGAPRGIIAVLAISSDPYFFPFDEKNPEFSGEIKVDGRYVLRFPIQTLERAFLKAVPGLENMSLFHGYQTKTNFPVSESEGRIIVKLIYALNPELPKIQGL